jgi:uncharacterized protein
VSLSEQDRSFIHPCLSCGACCASFRVAFYWREAERSEHTPTVPKDLCEDLTETLRCMSGTEVKHHPRCGALQGRIGQRVSCSIYTHRPSPCRQFQASYEEGVPNKKCDLARSKHGLRPLQRVDWSGR